TGEAGAEEVVVEAGAEQDEASAECGEPIAVGAWEPFEKALADEAAEIVGHLLDGIGLGQVALNEGAQLIGVEVADDGAELAEGAEESDHAGVAEAQAGGTSSGFAGRHDDGLEEAGGGSRAATLTLQVEQTAVDVAAEFDETGQVLQAAADAEVVG